MEKMEQERHSSLTYQLEIYFSHLDTLYCLANSQLSSYRVNEILVQSSAPILQENEADET